MSSTASTSHAGKHLLPSLTHYVTTHSPETKKAIFESAGEGQWMPFDEGKMGFNVVYTTSHPQANLNEEKDLKEHHELMESQTLGLVKENGTVCRIVDFEPGYTCADHRTQSIDLGVVIEGEVELILDSGEKKTMKRGDTIVQRATMHAWRNPSQTEWARMFFVLVSCGELYVGGEKMGEAIGSVEAAI